jgi:hypothetical protein
MAKDLMAPSHAVDAASNEWFDLSVDGRVRGATGGPSACTFMFAEPASWTALSSQ